MILRADAACLPLQDESVDLIITSPPYFSLRSYRDNGEHYDGQIGSEPHPREYLESLWTVMAECWRVLKPTGSCFVNLGDKRAGSGGHNNSNLGATSALSPHAKAQKASDGPRLDRATRRNAPDRYNQASFGRPKSKMLLPHRFAIGCEDGLADPDGVGWIMRQDIVWSKLNGLPESVTDRCRDSHEYLFHFTKQGRYFSAVDEVREVYAPATAERYAQGYNDRKVDTERCSVNTKLGGDTYDQNALGKLPGDVWPLASEPLVISDAIKAHYDLPDHFAAFPTELVRRVVLGWSPSAVCAVCAVCAVPIVSKPGVFGHDNNPESRNGERRRSTLDGGSKEWAARMANPDVITGYSSCDHNQPRPGVVLDVFGGTGTTAGVARALGRTGISVDLSADYCRLARWRTERSGHFAKVGRRTNQERQGVMV